MSKIITFGHGINIMAKDKIAKEDWNDNPLLRQEAIASAKKRICEHLSATIAKEMWQLIEFEINEESSDISGKLPIELSDELCLKFK